MKTTCNVAFSGQESITMPNGKQHPMYLIGQVVSGLVTISSSSQVKINKITVWGGFKVHGKGETENFFSILNEDDKNQISPEKPVVLPFSMQIPDDGPLSYDGECVKIDWLIKVDIDIPWALDEHSYHYIVVVPCIDDHK